LSYLDDPDDKLELFLQIKSMISEGNIRTKDIAKSINRSIRQTQRYFVQMSEMGLVTLTDTARIAITTEQIKKYRYTTITKEDFAKIPPIKKWINGCIARGVSPESIRVYRRSVRYIFSMMGAHPSDVITSRQRAIDFWIDFISEFKLNKPDLGTHGFRVAYKSFLAAHGITFANNVAKIYGLSSAHDKMAPYAGVYLTNEATKQVGKLILESGDFALYVWFRVCLRTGARPSAVSTMTWDRIYWNFQGEDGQGYFKLEQHETKDKRGQFHLGMDGEWKVKYVPQEIKALLLQWKEICPDKRFLWFKEGGSDSQNRRFALNVRNNMAVKLKTHYEKIKDMVDPLTQEYMMLKPHHVLRHTLVQQMKNADLSNDEIAECFGWRTPDIVGKWYSKTSERKKQELNHIFEKIEF